MAKPEWGTKRTGPCGTKFYDFNKSPIICPGCGGEVITNEVKTKTKKNEVDDHLKYLKKKRGVENSNDSDVLDSGILDDDIINENDSLNEEVENGLEDDISDDVNIV